MTQQKKQVEERSFSTKADVRKEKMAKAAKITARKIPPKPFPIKDTYTVRQTSLALGLSVKRVRQLIYEGKLVPVSYQPLIALNQLDVLAMRQEREAQGKTARPKATPQADISEVIASLNETFQKQLSAISESNQRNEETLIGQVNELRAEVLRLRARKWWQK